MGRLLGPTWRDHEVLLGAQCEWNLWLCQCVRYGRLKISAFREAVVIGISGINLYFGFGSALGTGRGNTFANGGRMHMYW